MVNIQEELNEFLRIITLLEKGNEGEKALAKRLRSVVDVINVKIKEQA